MRRVAKGWPIVGRDAVLAQVSALANDGCVVLVGGAGVGKTTVLREVRRLVEASGGRVELVVGAASDDDVPFGPFLGMLGPSMAPPREAEVAGRLRDALGERQGGRDVPILIVDDAHLLDEHSARVLLDLATKGSARVVGAVRTDERVPETIERLWTDGSCTRVELAPLTKGDVQQVLEEVLGGQVDPAATRQLAELAAGNGLFLYELVRAARDNQRFVLSHGVFCLSALPPIRGTLIEVVERRVAGLSETERTALELVALGEPLPIAAVEPLIDDQLMESMEAAQLIEARDTLTGTVVVSGHPLYGEVIRARVPRLRRRRLRLRLARALEDGAAEGSTEQVRAALWRLDADDPGDPERLLAAARAARTSSLEVAERLSRAALTATGATGAAILLAEILTHAGRTAEARDVLGGLPPATLAPTEREAIAYCQALGEGLQGAPDQGAAILDALDGREGAAPRLRALHAMLLFFDGRVEEAVQAGRPIVDDRAIDPAVRVLAASAVLGGYCYLGAFAELEELAAAAVELIDGAPDVPPYALGQVRVIALPALAESGRFDEVERAAQDMFDEAVTSGDNWQRSRGAFCLGRVALLRGRVRTATQLFRLTVASLNEFDQMFLPYNLSFLARSAAVAGEVEVARHALDLRQGGSGLRVFEPECELGEATISAAEGMLAVAAERAAWAAELAFSRHQWVIAMVAGHDAARFGGASSVLPLVRDAVSSVGGPLAWCYLDHVTALARSDAGALDQVGGRFVECGAVLYAAEAAAAAAAAYRAEGRHRAAAAAAAQSISLLAALRGAGTAMAGGDDQRDPGHCPRAGGRGSCGCRSE